VRLSAYDAAEITTYVIDRAQTIAAIRKKPERRSIS
jgi:hypothetical protein